MLTTIIFLSIAGIAVSSVSLYHHYGTSKSSYCDFGANFNCDMVNRSIYSEVAGVPVALIGVLGYCGLLSLATLYLRKKRCPSVSADGISGRLGVRPLPNLHRGLRAGSLVCLVPLIIGLDFCNHCSFGISHEVFEDKRQFL